MNEISIVYVSYNRKCYNLAKNKKAFHQRLENINGHSALIDINELSLKFFGELLTLMCKYMHQ